MSSGSSSSAGVSVEVFDLRSLTEAQLREHVERTLVIRNVFEQVYLNYILTGEEQRTTRVCCIGARSGYRSFGRKVKTWLREKAHCGDPERQAWARLLISASGISQHDLWH